MVTKHKLLVDKNCPMCSLYGNCFTRLNLIDESTLTTYQEVSTDIFNKIDTDRAKSEVALYDEATGKTRYGVDAFLFMLEGKSLWRKRVLRSKAVSFIALKLYNFITYNRHVMAGVIQNPSERDCTPAINKKYRWTYIVFVAALTGLILNWFTAGVDAQIGTVHSNWREWIICTGQIVWQFVAISIIKKEKRLDYLGNMSTVSLIGGLLLIPLLIVGTMIQLPLEVMLAYFSLVVMYMLFLHLKRSKNLGLPLLITVSWVTFRTLILAVILFTLIQ